MIQWSDSTGKHGIPQGEALFAMTNPVKVVPEFDEPRIAGAARPDLFIGPRWVGGPLLEVMAERRPPRGVYVFHVMSLRAKFRALLDE